MVDFAPITTTLLKKIRRANGAAALRALNLPAERERVQVASIMLIVDRPDARAYGGRNHFSEEGLLIEWVDMTTYRPQFAAIEPSGKLAVDVFAAAPRGGGQVLRIFPAGHPQSNIPADLAT